MRNDSRKRSRRAAAAALLLGALLGTTHAQQPKDAGREFNACSLFTAEDAATVLGTSVEQEVFKSKAPKVQPNCVYTAKADGKALLISVQFRFFRSPTEAVAALKEARLEARGQPLILSGQDAYWNAKQALLVVTKGNSIVTITAGPARENERVPELARKVAERLLPKLG
ncbi:MAG: hypothetical protein SF172_07605 [Burkholderiales bacterium]|nr:hypothetical protein [Burkholderiales bacterium]